MRWIRRHRTIAVAVLFALGPSREARADDSVGTMVAGGVAAAGIVAVGGTAFCDKGALKCYLGLGIPGGLALLVGGAIFAARVTQASAPRSVSLVVEHLSVTPIVGSPGLTLGWRGSF